MKLGNIVEKAGLTRRNLMEAAKLGAGAAAFPFVYGFLHSKLLVKSPMLAQNTPGEYAARALSGVVLGSLTNRMLKQPALGDGMVASSVGSVVRDLIAPMFNPAVAASQAAVTAAEKATGEAQATASNPVGTGMAGVAGFAGLGYNASNDQSLLFGVGTPDLSGASMFSGATVAVEDTTSGLSGATVAIEQQPNFAAALF